jgi:hypothetical protein
MFCSIWGALCGQRESKGRFDMGARKLFAQAAMVAIATLGAATANATAYVNSFTVADPNNLNVQYSNADGSFLIAEFKDLFASAPVGSTFDDSFTFNVNFLSSGTGSVSTSVRTAFNDLIITGLFFNGVDYSSFLTTTSSGTSANIGNLIVYDTMPNVLRLTGTVNGTGFYNGNATIAATAAVPEPATWAMMVVGFGALGAACRRSRAKTTKVAFS